METVHRNWTPNYSHNYLQSFLISPHTHTQTHTHTTYYIGYIVYHVYTHNYTVYKPLKDNCWKHLVQYQIKSWTWTTNETTVISSKKNMPSIQPMRGEQCYRRGTAPQMGESGIDFRRVLGNFQVTYSFCPHSVAVGSTQPLAETSTGRHVKPTDNSAVLVVQNVKVRMEVQHSISLLRLQDLLWERFTVVN